MEYFCDVENREAKEIVPGVRIRTFWGNEMLLSTADLAPNAVVPAHSHPQEQAGVVISGELELTIGEETRRLKPGETYIIPGGEEHSGRAGDTPARVLDIFSPVRKEYQY
jgi:quercetin dioxygenase-like cupin family protein